MLSTVIAALAASFLTASHPRSAQAAARTIPANGRVTTPDGVSFQLPAGLAYSVHDADGQRTYAAKDKEETMAVTVSAFLSDAKLPCDAAQSPEGVRVTRFQTPLGLRACSIDASSEDSPVGLSIIAVKSGETFVIVNGLAPSIDAAHRLAATVASSVRVGPASARGGLKRLDVPRGDPRLIGCFDDSTGYASSMGLARVSRMRCFREDQSFTERVVVASSVRRRELHGGPEVTAGASRGEREKQGVWSFDQGTLSVMFEDGTEASWDITFGETNVLAGNRLWERL